VKGILVDPVAKSVEYIVSEGGFSLGELHRLIGAEALDFCHPFGRTETVVVDDGGMFKRLTPFWIEGYGDSPIYGRAIIFGRDGGGGERSTGLTVEEVYELVSFP
jgi:hypothetical protein